MRTREEQLVDASLEVGKALLLAGGEVTRVEDTITRILHAYGMQKIGVFTITSLIEVTACTPDGDEIVKARRIVGGFTTNLNLPGDLFQLSPAPGDHRPYHGHQTSESRARLDKLCRSYACCRKLRRILWRHAGGRSGDGPFGLLYQLDGSEGDL